MRCAEACSTGTPKTTSWAWGNESTVDPTGAFEAEVCTEAVKNGTGVELRYKTAQNGTNETSLGSKCARIGSAVRWLAHIFTDYVCVRTPRSQSAIAIAARGGPVPGRSLVLPRHPQRTLWWP